MKRLNFIPAFPAFLAVVFLMTTIPAVVGQPSAKLKIKFVDWFFENGSPLCWEIQGDTLLKVSLLPDYERESLNRQTTHWNFRLEADSGTHVRLSISKMVNEVYNGTASTEWWDINHPISCYISYDRKRWSPVSTGLYGERELLVDFIMEKSTVWVARLPVYTISDLEKLKTEFRGNKFFTVINIGSTLEGRPLEIIRLGNADAKYSFIIRARAHPWEPGGSWIVEGIIRRFINENSDEWTKMYCVYIMPMANKDGVYKGMTRFNTAGMDLNRKWDKLSDPALCPEKYAFEKFIEGLIKKGIRPSLGIDIHNDDAGGINFSSLPVEDSLLVKREGLFEKLMREKTCFSEKASYPVTHPGQKLDFSLFDDGMYTRFGIDALVWELNANWIGRQGRMPTQDDWLRSGEMLNEVFYDFLIGIRKYRW